MSDSEKNDSHSSSGRNLNPEQTRTIDEEQFDATDAVRLFNRRIESALEKQRVAIVSEIHEKFQSKSSESCVLRAEGNRIQFSFNEEMLRSLELIERKLMIDDINEALDIIQKEKESLRQRNKILRIADKHGWDTRIRIWPIILRTLLNFVLLFLGQPQRREGITRTVTTTRIISPLNPGYSMVSLPDSFFAGIRYSSNIIKDSSTDKTRRILEATIKYRETTSSVCTVNFQGISPDSVPTLINNREDVQPQSQSQQSHLTQTTEKSKVEYCSEFSLLDIQSDFENANSVKNRLKHSYKFWENVLKPSDYILNVVKFGYRLEFEDLPDRVFLKNNKSALDNSGFVERSILQLLGKDLIRECPQAPFCVNPLTVSVPANKKPRLILDLRHVNFFILKRKIKFEGTKESLNFAKKGHYMIKFDLTSGYHHINIHEDHQQYLGFSWKINGKIRYFVFTVLPFGLSSAGYIFTKTLRPLVTHWRANSFPIIMYLDDGWVCDTKDNCERISSIIQTDLARAGFLVNQEKGIWKPSPKLDWLGFEWDLYQGVISIPFNKLENLRTKIEGVKTKKHVSARDLASIVGSIISFKFVLGPICQMFTRNLSILIAKTAYWDHYVQISKLESDELDFWFDNVLHVPNRVISPWFRFPDRMVFTDSSDYAGAGVLLESNKEYFHTM